MKKTILALALVSSLLYGCGNNEAQTEAQTEAPVESEQTMAATEASEEDDKLQSEVDTETESEEVTEERPTDEAGLREEGIQLVADDLGVQPEELAILIAEVDADDNDQEVEIDAFYDGTIYQYEIEKGAIKSKEENIKVDKELADELLIGTDALDLALQDAGLTKDDIYDYEIEIDEEDGKLVYEIEFKTNGQEYEYELDARTGEVLKKEM